MTTTPPEKRAGTSAKALLLTILGEFVLPRDGRAWTQSLVDGLATLGVGERNARQAIARTADQGFIDSERVGRRARWCLTAEGRELLTVGTERIYGFGNDGDEWDEHWLVVLSADPRGPARQTPPPAQPAGVRRLRLPHTDGRDQSRTPTASHSPTRSCATSIWSAPAPCSTPRPEA